MRNCIHARISRWKPTSSSGQTITKRMVNPLTARGAYKLINGYFSLNSNSVVGNNIRLHWSRRGCITVTEKCEHNIQKRTDDKKQTMAMEQTLQKNFRQRQMSLLSGVGSNCWTTYDTQRQVAASPMAAVLWYIPRVVFFSLLSSCSIGWQAKRTKRWKTNSF